MRDTTVRQEPPAGGSGQRDATAQPGESVGPSRANGSGPQPPDPSRRAPPQPPDPSDTARALRRLGRGAGLASVTNILLMALPLVFVDYPSIHVHVFAHPSITVLFVAAAVIAGACGGVWFAAAAPGLWRGLYGGGWGAALVLGGWCALATSALSWLVALAVIVGCFGWCNPEVPIVFAVLSGVGGAALLFTGLVLVHSAVKRSYGVEMDFPWLRGAVASASMGLPPLGKVAVAAVWWKERVRLASCAAQVERRAPLPRPPIGEGPPRERRAVQASVAVAVALLVLAPFAALAARESPEPIVNYRPTVTLQSGSWLNGTLILTVMSVHLSRTAGPAGLNSNGLFYVISNDPGVTYYSGPAGVGKTTSGTFVNVTYGDNTRGWGVVSEGDSIRVTVFPHAPNPVSGAALKVLFDDDLIASVRLE